ncbi:g6659 [Coccomyxa viridis]|uniref:Mitochondrial Rho GTPase n=1 Tax=Coccomyxa viridis TaxID=1274662 RepID=A0ABP1G2F5_9CHLO
MRPAKPVRIVVVGDAGVGKSSLITAAATESFSEHPPPVLPPTRLAHDTTPEGVPMVLVDTSSRPEDKANLELACRNADVVILCFDSGRPQSLKRISDSWVPELQRMGVEVPYLLVGCKSDLRQPGQTLQQTVVPTMSRCKLIETCLECSARTLTFVGEVFYYALKAVVYPMAPVFNLQANDGIGALTPLCVKALKRIFLMSDLDKDGVLSDSELNDFQVQCFAVPLQPEELAGVKAVVSQKMPEGVRRGGLTLPGFLFLHTLFIERGRLETTWQVLRRFGYDGALHLSQDTLDEVSFQRSPDQVVELTEVAKDFLSACFEEFDMDNDRILSPAEQDVMYSTSPSRSWSRADEERVLLHGSTPHGVSKQAYLLQWVYKAAIQPSAALEHMLLLGYRGEPSALFSVSAPRRQERKLESARRSVFQCFVFGPAQSGKSSLLRALAGSAEAALPPGKKSALVRQRDQLEEGAVTAVLPMRTDIAQGGEHATTLILSEQSSVDAERMAAGSGAADLAPCDLAILLFDSSSLESVTEALQLLLSVTLVANNNLPCVMLAAKDDLGMSPDVERECAAACASLAMPMPLNVSLRAEDLSQLQRHLLELLQEQEPPVPFTPSLKAAKRYRQLMRKAALYTAGGTLIGLAIFGSYRAYRSHCASKQVEQSSRSDIPQHQVTKARDALLRGEMS